MLWVGHSFRRVLPVVRVYKLKKVEVTYDAFGHLDAVKKKSS